MGYARVKFIPGNRGHDERRLLTSPILYLVEQGQDLGFGLGLALRPKALNRDLLVDAAHALAPWMIVLQLHDRVQAEAVYLPTIKLAVFALFKISEETKLKVGL